MRYKAINCKEVIDFEMSQRKGRTVISCKFCPRWLRQLLLTFDSVCVNDAMNDEIRRLLQDRVDDTISIKELDFRPTK